MNTRFTFNQRAPRPVNEMRIRWLLRTGEVMLIQDPLKMCWNVTENRSNRQNSAKVGKSDYPAGWHLRQSGE